MRMTGTARRSAGVTLSALVGVIVAGGVHATPIGTAAGRPGGQDRVLIVAPSGAGRFHTVQAAIDAVRPWSGPVTIIIEKGTYWGQVYVPPDKPDITLVGATGDPRDVVLVDDLAHGDVAPNGNIYSTSCSATLSVAGNGFSAYDITVENSFDPTAHPGVSPQAVAVKTVADRVVYADDRLLGGQDTVYASSYADPRTPEECFAPGGPPASVPPGEANPPPARQLYVHDVITGDVDFLFGSATAVFANDTIDILGHPGGTIAAPDTPLSRRYGLLITGSRIVNSADNLPTGSYYLARPWPHTGVTDPVGQITVRDSSLPAAINPQQWLSWSSPPLPWQDARFYEYRNTGPGAAAVAPDVPQLTPAQASRYTIARYLHGWHPRIRPPRIPSRSG